MVKKQNEGFIPMSDTKILTHPEHPLYQLFTQKLDSLILYDQAPLELTKGTTLYDFTCLGTEKKDALFSSISTDSIIYSDLTCAWGDYLFEKHSHLKGAIALSFYSPRDTYEIALKEDTAKDGIEDILNQLGLKIKQVSRPGIGFTTPRVVSQIINEAYFALEDKLAAPEDIDTAMQYGVNYPMGPLAWSEKTGESTVCLLLDELYRITGDPRYRASQLLRKQSLLLSKDLLK